MNSASELPQNSNVLTALYDTPWYLMPPNERKMIQHAMNRMQNGAVVQMGPFSELNFLTASNVSYDQFI